MCGIAGLAGAMRTDRHVLSRMTDALRHRGPDGEGSFWDQDVGLAMRRLAIIDVAGGDQPIYSEDRSVCVVFNGEIYNFQELRAELRAAHHHFETASDTEVVVHAYEEYGPECVERLWGMFAFALWDSHRQLLLLARDRLGKKPLVYYAAPDGGLAFASELQALLAHPSIPRELNHTAIDDYLTYLYVPAPTTAYKNVWKLPPGHRLTWTPGRAPQVERYWDLGASPDLTCSEDEALNMFGDLVRDATRRRMVADVPVGVFLSGGLDSSSIVAHMAGLSARPIKTFSIGFSDRDFDELRYARLVAQRFGTDHHELIVEPDALAILPRLVEHYGEPYGDSSAVPTYYLSQITRQHVTVALNGDGGDELLAGYERHWAAGVAAHYDRLPEFVRNGLIRPLVPLMPETRRRSLVRRAKRFMTGVQQPIAQRYLHWVGAMTPTQKSMLYTPDFKAALAGNDSSHWLRDLWSSMPRGDAVQQFQRADTLLYLPNDLLAKVDITSMANSLEARSPLLDHRIVELCAALPTRYKLRGRTSKWLLRRLMRDQLPAEILSRPKMGFGVPVGEWLRGDLRPLLDDTVLSSRALARGYFTPGAVRSLVDDHVSARVDRTAQVWALLMLELWFRAFIDRARESQSGSATDEKRVDYTRT